MIFRPNAPMQKLSVTSHPLSLVRPFRQVAKRIPPTDADLVLREKVAIANRPLVIYDLETTTFMGASNFGITEIGALVYFPEGDAYALASLVNPQNLISPMVTQLTGINQSMVRDRPTWAAWAPFLDSAMQHSIVVGFNNQTFDNKAVVDQNRRYGCIGKGYFASSFDIYQEYKRIAGVKKGKLPEVAASLGVTMDDLQKHWGDWLTTTYGAKQAEAARHRALGDSLLTALSLAAALKHPDWQPVLDEFFEPESKAFRVDNFSPHAAVRMTDAEAAELLHYGPGE